MVRAYLVAASLLAACEPESHVVARFDEIVASPDDYVGGKLTIQAVELSVTNEGGTLVLCDEPGCNVYVGRYAFPTSDGRTVRLRASRGWDGPSIFAYEAYGSVRFGCYGSDARATCVPTLPNRILSITGRLRRDDEDLVFRVSEVAVAPGPSSEEGAWPREPLLMEAWDEPSDAGPPYDAGPSDTRPPTGGDAGASSD